MAAWLYVMVIVTLTVVPEGKANLSDRQVPHLGGVISQAISPLEDPDEGVRTIDRRVVLH